MSYRAFLQNFVFLLLTGGKTETQEKAKCDETLPYVAKTFLFE